LESYISDIFLSSHNPNTVHLYSISKNLSAIPKTIYKEKHSHSIQEHSSNYYFVFCFIHLSFSHLSFNHLSFSHLSFNHLSFNHLSFSHLSFSHLSFNHLCLFVYYLYLFDQSCYYPSYHFCFNLILSSYPFGYHLNRSLCFDLIGELYQGWFYASKYRSLEYHRFNLTFATTTYPVSFEY